MEGAKPVLLLIVVFSVSFHFMQIKIRSVGGDLARDPAPDLFHRKESFLGEI